MTALSRITGACRDLLRDQRGNVFMILGFAIIPLTYATGMAIDYSRASRLETKLDAAADAAALAAVSDPVMKQNDNYARRVAKAMFESQIADLPGLVYDTANLTITISSSSGATNQRTATVSYTAKSDNEFSGVLGMATLDIEGTSTATSAEAPNIDFFVMIDTSPSMLLPATTAGLATMVTKTGGCAFACHQTNLTYGSGNTELVCDASKKNCIDFYTVARNNSLVLRTDLVHQAVKDMTDTAKSTSDENDAVYRFGLFQFDYQFKQVWPTISALGLNVDSDLARVKGHVDDAQILSYCQNNYRVCGINDNDMATNFTTSLLGATTAMPLAPGTGTNVAGDSPQAMLFIVTDGMRDENLAGSRKLGPIPTAQCDLIKARGIRIAVLNTKYLPESASDSWSITNVRNPYLSPDDKVSPALQACASPGLYYQVTTDSDISAALISLFQKAVSTAHLTD